MVMLLLVVSTINVGIIIIISTVIISIISMIVIIIISIIIILCVDCVVKCMRLKHKTMFQESFLQKSLLCIRTCMILATYMHVQGTGLTPQWARASNWRPHVRSRSQV